MICEVANQKYLLKGCYGMYISSRNYEKLKMELDGLRSSSKQEC